MDISKKINDIINEYQKKPYKKTIFGKKKKKDVRKMVEKAIKTHCEISRMCFVMFGRYPER